MKKFAIAFVLMGAVLIASGTTGWVYTWSQATNQDVTVSGDAAWFAEKPVRGPFTMLSQSATIEKHNLDRTDGNYYAQMERGDELRSSWVTATTLTTALGLGVLAYGVSGLAFVVGIITLLLGIMLWREVNEYERTLA